MKYLILFMAIFVGINVGLTTTNAQILPTYYTTDNFLLLTHEQPASFQADGLGGFVGLTETGRVFTQQNIFNDSGIKIHKFSIDEAYFYISDRGVIYAKTDIAAISAYLARV